MAELLPRSSHRNASLCYSPLFGDRIVRIQPLLLSLSVLIAAGAVAQQSDTQAKTSAAAPPQTQMYVEPSMPYTPSLDVTAMDRSIDPCVDFYTYSCGGWQKNNPIPPDQTSWSVYGKLYQDNLAYLRGILEQAAVAKDRDAVTQKIGDYYAACMDEARIEKRGAKPIWPALVEIQGLQNLHEMAPLIARLHLEGETMLFSSGSQQDPNNSDAMIVGLDQDGLGLPDRDYYTKDDAKSKEIRQRYLQHVRNMLQLIGDSPETARKEAATVMRIETAIAKASLTQVDLRDPYKVTHKMKIAELNHLAPNFDWTAYFCHQPGPTFRSPQRGVAGLLQGLERPIGFGVPQ